MGPVQGDSPLVLTCFEGDDASSWKTFILSKTIPAAHTCFQDCSKQLAMLAL